MGPHTGAEEQHEEGVAEVKCYKLATIPIPSIFPCATGSGDVEESGVKLSLGRWNGWGGFVVLFLFLTILLYFYW